MAAIVAIGASQGGVAALRSLASALPADFAAPVVVVLHIGTEQSIMPTLLEQNGRLTASHAKHGEALRPGHIFVAPPDRHLMVIDGRVELSHGPRENWTRPAIDPLFRSVAESHGPDAIGVILTGRLNDGTPGLYEIKRRGGVAIVQDPETAEAPDMPQSAIDNVPVDHRLPLEKIPGCLVALINGGRVGGSGKENRGALVMTNEEILDKPVAQTCPECGGAMREETLGKLTRFRCHIGHIMTAEVLAASQLQVLQTNSEAMLRSLNERVDLCRRMAAKQLKNGNQAAAALWQRAADEAAKWEAAAKSMTEADWLRPEQTVGQGK